MSRSKHCSPPKRINNTFPQPSAASAGVSVLEELARLLGRQEAKTEYARHARPLARAAESFSNE